MATKATQTHSRGIRSSSQEIAIFAKRFGRLCRFCQPLGRYILVSIQRAKMDGTLDIGGKRCATSVGLSKKHRLTELFCKPDARGGCGRRPGLGRMAKAKSIGWAIYVAGFVIWLFGYLSTGHAAAFDWDGAAPSWISSFVPNLEAEFGLALMFASMIPIYWRAGRKRQGAA